MNQGEVKKAVERAARKCRESLSEVGPSTSKMCCWNTCLGLYSIPGLLAGLRNLPAIDFFVALPVLKFWFVGAIEEFP
jgi:hypothetical protein